MGAAPEVKERPAEKQSSRQASLPPVEVGSTMMLKVEDLDMLARLKLAREKEEDCMESLVDLGETDHDQEDGAYDEDDASEVSSRSESSISGGRREVDHKYRRNNKPQDGEEKGDLH